MDRKLASQELRARIARDKDAYQGTGLYQGMASAVPQVSRSLARL